MPEETSPATGADTRQAVLGLAGRLEPLWREALTRTAAASEPTPESQRWDAAADSLEHAMTALERFSASVDPSLGRRDWRSRRLGHSAVDLRLPAARVRP